MYRRLCKTLKDRGTLIPHADDVYGHIEDLTLDHYLSVYMYNDKQRDEILSTVEDIRNGKVIERIKGASGITSVVTDQLVFDFDIDKDKGITILDVKDDTQEAIKRLLKIGIVEDAIQVFFSGNKGFGIVVDIDQLISPEKHKTIAREIAKGIKSWDSKIYNSSRIIRVAFTKHPISGLYKIPLLISELSETVDTIKEWAKGADKEIMEYDRVSIPASVKNLPAYTHKKLAEVSSPLKKKSCSIDFKKKPNWLSHWKYALAEGYFPSGTRNQALLILGATYFCQGFNKLTNYRMLKGAAELQSKRFNQDRFPDTQIWVNIIDQVYSNNWNGGTFSEDSFCDELVEYFEDMKIPRINAEEGRELITINDVFDTFENFAENIEKNTIRTGIKQLDDQVRITTSMLVGILGSPGCHAKGTEIMMCDGSSKEVENIIVGDRLMGPDSSPREVLNLCRGREEMVRFIPKVSEPFVVNMSHILPMVSGSERVNIKVSDLLGDRASEMKDFKLEKAAVSLPHKKFGLDPHSIGFWLGESTFGGKFIPDFYLLSSKAQRLDLLSGLIDAAGSPNVDKNGWIMPHVDKTFPDGVLRLCTSLGITAEVKEKDGIYTVCISDSLGEELPLRCEAKKTKDGPRVNTPLQYEYSYEILPEDDFYGFTLSGDHLYLTSDFMIHHNSGKTATILNILNNHSNNGESSIFFSFDMGKPLIYQKLAQKLTGYQSDDLFKLFQENNIVEKDKIKTAVHDNFYNTQMCFRTGSTVDDMKRYIINFQNATGKQVRMIAVDYLEKLVGPFSEATANSGYNAAKLQELANDLGICVLLLLQPQKLAGDPSEPLLSYRRIKGASQIEQDCRVIVSLYREGYDPKSYDNDNFITFSVLKNTMGELGSVDCRWEGLTGNITPIDDAGKVELGELRQRKKNKKILEMGSLR